MAAAARRGHTPARHEAAPQASLIVPAGQALPHSAPVMFGKHAQLRTATSTCCVTSCRAAAGSPVAEVLAVGARARGSDVRPANVHRRQREQLAAQGQVDGRRDLRALP